MDYSIMTRKERRERAIFRQTRNLPGGKKPIKSSRMLLAEQLIDDLLKNEKAAEAFEVLGYKWRKQILEYADLNGVRPGFQHIPSLTRRVVREAIAAEKSKAKAKATEVAA